MVFIVLVVRLKIHKSPEGKFFETRNLEVTDSWILICILLFLLSSFSYMYPIFPGELYISIAPI